MAARGPSFHPRREPPQRWIMQLQPQISPDH
jgi:hypothetical protein